MHAISNSEGSSLSRLSQVRAVVRSKERFLSVLEAATATTGESKDGFDASKLSVQEAPGLGALGLSDEELERLHGPSAREGRCRRRQRALLG